MKMTGGQLQAGVIECAEWHGWMVYHVANVKGQLRSKTGVGFPDLVLVHPERGLCIIPECKGEKESFRPGQKEWGQAIANATYLAHCVWRPEHYDDALAFLAGKKLFPPNMTPMEER